MPKIEFALCLILLLSLLILISPINPVGAASDVVKWSRVNIPSEGKLGNWVLADGSGLGSNDINAIVVDQEAKLWAAHNEGVSVFDGSKWTNYGWYGADIEVESLSLVNDIAVDNQGRIWAVTDSDGVSVFHESNWETYTRENSGLVGGLGRAIACDGHGRIWVGTTFEVAVFNGGQWLTYTPGTSGLVTSGVNFIACTEAGPSSLPLPHGPRTGSISGRVIRAGAPVAGAEVNVCWEVSYIMFTGPTPCEGEVYLATTDDEGRFSIADIPIGVYELAVYVPEEGKWYTGGSIVGIPARHYIESGEDTNVGDLSLPRP